MKNEPNENVYDDEQAGDDSDNDKDDHKIKKCEINLLIWITFPICVLWQQQRQAKATTTTTDHHRKQMK